MLLYTTVLPFVLSLLTLVTAQPTETVERRSYTTDVGMCYYTCPTILGATATDSSEGSCNYDNGLGIFTCTYDTTTGANTSGLGCPAQADGPVCQETPPEGGFRKRKLRRERSAAEKAIARRQWKPKYRKGELKK